MPEWTPHRPFPSFHDCSGTPATFFGDTPLGQTTTTVAPIIHTHANRVCVPFVCGKGKTGVPRDCARVLGVANFNFSPRHRQHLAFAASHTHPRRGPALHSLAGSPPTCASRHAGRQHRERKHNAVFGFYVILSSCINRRSGGEKERGVASLFTPHLSPRNPQGSPNEPPPPPLESENASLYTTPPTSLPPKQPSVPKKETRNDRRGRRQQRKLAKMARRDRKKTKPSAKRTPRFFAYLLHKRKSLSGGGEQTRRVYESTG